VDDKLKILKHYDERCTSKKQKEIADELDLPPSTLRTILENREAIEANAMHGGVQWKKVKVGKFDDLEKVLLEWFSQTCALHLPINGPILTKKAKEIALQLHISDFTASNSSLDRFKNRHGIIYRQISGEREAVNEVDLTSWNEHTLPALLQYYKSTPWTMCIMLTSLDSSISRCRTNLLYTKMKAAMEVI